MEDGNELLDAAYLLRGVLAKLNRRLRAQDGSGGVGSTGLSLLGRLHRDGPSTAAELAAREGLQPQSITRALQSLDERDLIGRAVDDADRRRSIIAISPRGVDLLRESARSRVRWLAAALSVTLSSSERDMLRIAVSLLERVADFEE